MTKQVVRKSSTSATQTDQTTGRLFSLDLLKAMSITAVVSYHSIFVPRFTYADSLETITMLFAPLRFCVPVLFTLSFMLFARDLSKHINERRYLIKKRLLRLVIPTVFWFSLATGLKILKGNSPFEIIYTIADGTIFQGAYYLLVLLQFIPIFILLSHWLNSLKHFLLVVLLQGLVFLLIYIALSGIFETQSISILRTIGRPLFAYWFVYMALGSYFWKNWSSIVKLSTRIPTNIKIVVICLNCLLLIIESQYLFITSRGFIPPFDYAMFSCTLSVIVFFICFASVEENQLPWFVKRIVFLLSKYSLGIFCINGIMSEVFLSIGSRMFSGATLSLLEVLVIKFACWIFLTCFSLQLSIMLEKLGWRAIVS